MNLTTRGKTYTIIGILSFVFSYLIITLGYFPHFGMAATLIAFALFSYNHKKTKNTDTHLYLAFTLVFSVLLFVRSEPLITFFNICASLFFGSLMLTSGGNREPGFLDHLFSPIILIAKSVFTKADYYLEYEKGRENAQKEKTVNTLFGILVSVFLLLIVIPLLSSANPYFSRMVGNVLNFFNIENFLINLGYQTVFVWSFRLIFFLAFLLMIPKVITIINKVTDFSMPLTLKLETFTLQIPKLVLGVVLLIFFFTQIEFYFASQETLINLGLSYSQHAREVFAQLSLVAGIVMVLLYNDRRTTKVEKILDWTLGVQGIFLTLMAYKSAFEYINAWGLTYIRLYGVTFATWVTGIFILYFINYQLRKTTDNFVGNVILYSGVLLFLVNILNFDYLIYHFKKAATGQGVDYTYLSTLSPDSFSYKDQYLKLEEATKTREFSLITYDNKNPLILLTKIERLQGKYSTFDLRTFNAMDYLQYLDIKDLKTNELRSIYSLPRTI